MVMTDEEAKALKGLDYEAQHRAKGTADGDEKTEGGDRPSEEVSQFQPLQELQLVSPPYDAAPDPSGSGASDAPPCVQGDSEGMPGEIWARGYTPLPRGQHGVWHKTDEHGGTHYRRADLTPSPGKGEWPNEETVARANRASDAEHASWTYTGRRAYRNGEEQADLNGHEIPYAMYMYMRKTASMRAALIASGPLPTPRAEKKKP